MQDIFITFNEALAALDKVGKRKKFDEKVTPKMPIEAKVNLAETILKESRVIRKYNGAADNGHQEFTEAGGSGGSYITEKHDPFAKGDAIMMESMRKVGFFSEDEYQRLTNGGRPSEYNTLTESQKKEYDMAIRFRFSESDALKLARLPNHSLTRSVSQ